MIERFATWILQGRMRAILVVTVFSALSLMLPPFGHISGGALALVVLRRGLREGVVVMLAATVLLGLIGGMSHLDQRFAIIFVLVTLAVIWLPTLLAAAVLRRSRSMGTTLALVGVVAVAILSLHGLVVGDVAAWWREVLQVLLVPALRSPESPVSPDEVSRIIDGMALAASGILAATLVYTTMINVFLGRWLQAILYNPGGFSDEFFRIRLARPVAIVALLVLLMSAVAEGSLGHFVFNLLLVIVAMFSLQGLSLVHATVQIMGASKGWLMGLYGLMVFLLPQVMVVLSAAGVADSWVDFRRRLSAGQKG